MEKALNVRRGTNPEGAVMVHWQLCRLLYAVPGLFVRITVPEVVMAAGDEHCVDGVLGVVVNEMVAATPAPTTDESDENTIVIDRWVAVTGAGRVVPLARNRRMLDTVAPSNTLKKS